MKAFINLLTLEITRHKPLDPSLTLDMTAEEVGDGRDEFDHRVDLLVTVPPGTLLHIALAPQIAKANMN